MMFRLHERERKRERERKSVTMMIRYTSSSSSSHEIVSLCKGRMCRTADNDGVGREVSVLAHIDGKSYEDARKRQVRTNARASVFEERRTVDRMVRTSGRCKDHFRKPRMGRMATSRSGHDSNQNIDDNAEKASER